MVAGYRLAARLGAGGMGKVYLSHTPGGRPVAIKVIRPEFAEDPEFRRRFAQEVQSAQRVQGLFTAPVIDADAEAATPWLATAYVPGPTVAAAVAEHGALPAHTVLMLVAGIAEALQVIHGAGIVHRDLKPSNVLLASDGPRVIDFGIARAADGTSLTASGVAVGTPSFMAPEQASGSRIGPATDVFALGQVAAYAALGAPAYGEGPSHGVLYRIVHEEPRLEGLPEELRPLVERCLVKEPDGRATLAEVLELCRAADGGTQLRRPEDWLPGGLAAGITSRVAVVPGPVPTTVDPGGAAGAGGAAAAAGGYQPTAPAHPAGPATPPPTAPATPPPTAPATPTGPATPPPMPAAAPVAGTGAVPTVAAPAGPAAPAAAPVTPAPHPAYQTPYPPTAAYAPPGGAHPTAGGYGYPTAGHPTGGYPTGGYPTAGGPYATPAPVPPPGVPGPGAGGGGNRAGVVLAAVFGSILLLAGGCAALSSAFNGASDSKSHRSTGSTRSGSGGTASGGTASAGSGGGTASGTARPRTDPKPADYPGFEFPAGYHLELGDDPLTPHDSPFADDLSLQCLSSDGCRFRSYTTKLVLLDSAEKGSLDTCRTATRFTNEILVETLSKGAQICLHTKSGNIALVTYKGMSGQNDPSQHTTVDVTVWRGALEPEES
ncbi:serine/threonine-protein kinase [Streptomyces sp. NPDC093225]|uniref:serine/threonine-protein kinase n=1 Tax=Streptomyces sp. NPDC093225 TaxID=3366034 RepID=UPI0037FCFC5D